MATGSEARPGPFRRALVPRRWLRLPTRTARLRLTLLYTGLFFLLGTGLLILVLLLVKSSATISVASPVGSGTRITPAPYGPPSPRAHDVVVQQHNADIAHVVAMSWVVLILTTVGAAILGWFAAGRVLRPLREITTTARTISAGNLHQRLALTGPNDEFKQLGDTLDDLLGRLEASFEAQRRFVANASHELRTPLTVERTLLQVALADPNLTPERLRATCEELLASQVEHERLLESLLTLASSERGLERRDALDLAILAQDELVRAQDRIAQRGLELVSILDPAALTGDEALLYRLIANLLDNAVDHNVDGGRIEIRTESQLRDVVLTVRSTGPHIAPSDTERMFDPFQRLEARRASTSGHYGLGLSIVRAIAIAHGGQASAQAEPNGGLVVTVSLPTTGLA